jgi:hypothetical protein
VGVSRQLVLDETAGDRRFNGHVVASADGTRSPHRDRHAAVADHGAMGASNGSPSGRRRHRAARCPHRCRGHLARPTAASCAPPRTASADRSHGPRWSGSMDSGGERLAGGWRSAPEPAAHGWSAAPGATGTAGIAMQAEHDEPARRAEAPVLASGKTARSRSQLRDLPRLARVRRLRGGGLSCRAIRSAAALAAWRPPHGSRRSAQLQQAYALPLVRSGRAGRRAHRRDARHRAVHPPAGGGALPWPEPMALDNHCLDGCG